MIDFNDGETKLIDPDTPDLPQASFGEDTLKRHYFSDRNLYIGHHPYLCVDVRDFLNRTSFARTTVPCSYDATIGALTQFFDKLILRVYDKGRVQRRKTMSLHRG